MTHSYRRFMIYGLLGITFGIFDWFYLNGLAHFRWGSLGNSLIVIPIILLLNYGIWLLPVIPIGIIESKRNSTMLLAAFACSLTWVFAMVGYYGYYALLFIRGKLPMLENVRLNGINDPVFWRENGALFQRVIVNQFIEWTLIAVVCGSIIGILLFKIVHRQKA